MTDRVWQITTIQSGLPLRVEEMRLRSCQLTYDSLASEGALYLGIVTRDTCPGQRLGAYDGK
jgi:hypothetical protein